MKFNQPRSKGMNFNIPKVKIIPVHSIGVNSKSFRKEKEEKARKKIRNPVKYLVEKHGVSKRYAKLFLAQPAVIAKNWKEDNSGSYIDSDTLDIIGYGWKKERKEFMETLESTEKLRKVSRKAMKKDYGKILSKKEMGEKIEKLPKKYQKRLRRTQRIMKKIS